MLGFVRVGVLAILRAMADNDWTRILGWPGYKVYRHELDERGKRLKLWARRKRANKQLVCSGCGKLVSDIVESYERDVRDLPCFEYLTTVVVELYRVRCPDCGVRTERVPLLPSKAPFSKRFEDEVGQACESAAAIRVARRFGLSASTVRASTRNRPTAGHPVRVVSSSFIQNLLFGAVRELSNCLIMGGRPSCGSPVFRIGF